VSLKLKKIAGQNLRGYRKLKELTQEEIAALSHVPMNTIARLERADKQIGFSLTTLGKISKALEIDPYLLLIPHSYKRHFRIVERAKS